MLAVLEFRVQLAFWCGSGVSREIILDVGAPSTQRITMEALFGRSADARVDAMKASLEDMLGRVDAAEKATLTAEAERLRLRLAMKEQKITAQQREAELLAAIDELRARGRDAEPPSARAVAHDCVKNAIGRVVALSSAKEETAT